MSAKLLMHIFGLNEKDMRSVVALVEIAESTILMTEQTVIRIIRLG